MRWQVGRETVERLLQDGELQRVAPDIGAARSLLATARRHLSSAATIRETDPEGAYVFCL